MEKKAKVEAELASAQAGFDAAVDAYEAGQHDDPSIVRAPAPMDSVEALLGEQVYRALCRVAESDYRTPVGQIKYLVREAAINDGVWEE